MKQPRIKLLATGYTTIAFVMACMLTGVPKVLADYPYDSANLISDSLFTNSSSMSVAAIQTFLNNENSGIRNLTDTENCSSTKTPYSFNYYPNCGKTVSAATIIYDAGQAYGINPQAIMATMQKEQSLVSDPSPSAAQINCAMGYNSCSGYVGFFSQVDNGAWQFRTYIELMNGRSWWGYASSSYPCASANSNFYSTGLFPGNIVTFYDKGGTAETITLADSATAALYCYTPYVGPLSTTGYSGSYNFVQAFEQWFGSTVYPYGAEVTATTYSDSARTQELSLSGALSSGQKIYVTVSALNTGNQTWYPSSTRVATENPNNRSSAFSDSSWYAYNRPAQLIQSSVSPGQTGTFEFSLTTPNVDGEYHEDFGLVADGQVGGWMQDSATFGFDIKVSNPYNGYITQFGSYSDSNYSQPIDSAELVNGEKVYIQLKVKNIGTQTWSNAFTNVATENPNNRSSAFSDSSWSATDRPTTMIESSVVPGQTGTFRFDMTTPSTNGAYNETFGLVADGQNSGWMPAPVFSLPITVSGAPIDDLIPGMILYPGQSIESKSGQYRMALQSDGNLVNYAYINNTWYPIWASGTNGKGASTLIMQGDGNLVLYNGSGNPIWASGTNGKGASTLIMQGDGNLVLYNGSGNPIWASGTNVNIGNTPTSLTLNTSISQGALIISPDGQHRLGLQGDGNLVLYNGSGNPIWASGTSGKGGSTLLMQNDGNLVLYNGSGNPIWASGTSGK